MANIQKQQTAVQLSAEERALITGDLNDLSEEQRAAFYMSVCQSLGLNPLTRPFQYIEMWDGRRKKNKLMLYAGKDCTEQLRKLHKVSLSRSLEKEFVKELGIYTVTAYMRTIDGREDSAIGAVNIKGLSGDDLANAIMKAETKAKRRCTLAICGLAMLDESEIETVRNAQYPQQKQGEYPTTAEMLEEWEADKVEPELEPELNKKKPEKKDWSLPGTWHTYIQEIWTYYGVNDFEARASFKKFTGKDILMEECLELDTLKKYAEYKKNKCEDMRLAAEEKKAIQEEM